MWLFFEELVRRDPDITLFELRDALAEATGDTVHHSAIAGLGDDFNVGYEHSFRPVPKPSLVGLS